MPTIPPIAPAPTIQIFTRWFLKRKEDWSAHRSRAGYPAFCKGALASRLVQDRGEARDEKSVLNKLRVQPDFVVPPRCEGGSPFSPLAKGGRRFPRLRRGVAVFPACVDCSFPSLAKGGNSVRHKICARHWHDICAMPSCVPGDCRDRREAKMARRRRRDLQPGDIEGLEYFDALAPLLARL